MAQHQTMPILPCNDIDATQAFYERLGFTVTGGDSGFRILTDGRGWQLALRPAEQGWVIPDRNSASPASAQNWVRLSDTDQGPALR
ncbi:hypothetical protein OK349_09995 [Sphingomonas sp. BT-65]|uniref:hypothetical protein n=1 Tax=Sphingomonas sp. BT-65 TaxID=2989821 RepID=UPI002236A93C|nr:hypothetical protein [Sphingomonas sp. BT-65]MCW4462038.1 hypothetical protein [Sphingomonas sp. BT-65]